MSIAEFTDSYRTHTNSSLPEAVGLPCSLISVSAGDIFQVNDFQWLLVSRTSKVLEFISIEHKPSLLPILNKKSVSTASNNVTCMAELTFR